MTQSSFAIAELEGSGATVREYIWLVEAEIAPTRQSRAQVDRPIAVVDGVNTGSPQLYMVHVDHLARPVRLTNSSKASVWDAVYTPWGAPHSVTGTVAQNARFPGQWFHIEAGLHYNWHRHYDPGLGRYTQPDPLGFVDGPSVYAYAGSSPQVYVDPEGKFRFTPPRSGPRLYPNPRTRPAPYTPNRPSPPIPGPQSDYDFYKDVCNQPPPPNLSKCQKALWLLGRATHCLALRKKWKQNYGPRPHDGEIENREREKQNAEDRAARDCKDEPEELMANFLVPEIPNPNPQRTSCVQ